MPSAVHVSVCDCCLLCMTDRSLQYHIHHKLYLEMGLEMRYSFIILEGFFYAPEINKHLNQIHNSRLLLGLTHAVDCVICSPTLLLFVRSVCVDLIAILCGFVSTLVGPRRYIVCVPYREVVFFNQPSAVHVHKR